MRKLVLLAASVSLLLAPSALAHARPAAAPSCPPPEITHAYDTESLAVHLKLPASGCAAREHRMFMVSAQVTRYDDHGPTGSIDRSVMCGPFRSAADRGPDEAPAEYSCELDVAFEHPDVETIRYDIDVAYPGETSARNTTLTLACTSDGTSAVCDNETA